MSKTRSFPRVCAVRAYKTKSVPATSGSQGADCHDVGNDHWIDGNPIPIANPMSGYAQYAKSRFVPP